MGFEPTPPKRLEPKSSALDRSAIEPTIFDPPTGAYFATKRVRVEKRKKRGFHALLMCTDRVAQEHAVAHRGTRRVARDRSELAQRKRVGLITKRSEDRNLDSLALFLAISSWLDGRAVQGASLRH